MSNRPDVWPHTRRDGTTAVPLPAPTWTTAQRMARTVALDEFSAWLIKKHGLLIDEELLAAVSVGPEEGSTR